MKRLKEKYAERTRDVLYELWHFSHNMHETYSNKVTSYVKVPNKSKSDDFSRDKLLELIKKIDEYTDRLYLIRKSWYDDLEALAEVLTSEEGEQYLEQVDLPESLVKTVLGE